MSWIMCECGDSFWGQRGKEDTCPKCLKLLLKPQKEIKRGEGEPN